MIQFIDLERYVFNYSPYDIYTNAALQNVPSVDFTQKRDQLENKHFNQIKTSYLENNYIFDKNISSFLEPKVIGPKHFADETEYQIMIRILKTPFIHDIKTFCQVMETNLPEKYMIKPLHDSIVEYYIDLDANQNRIIN